MSDILVKAIAREAFFEGYEMGYGVEELDAIDRRMMDEQFERWWKRNGVQ